MKNVNGKLLITGGCGFLGSNLAAEAIRQGLSLTIYDNLTRDGSKSNLDWLLSFGQFEFIQGDIRDSQSIEKCINSLMPDYIFHNAGQVAMTTSIMNPRLDFEINALGTINLLESVRKCSPHSVIVYSSTNKVFGDLSQHSYVEAPSRYICQDKPNGFDESTPLSFHSPYGCSKGAADQYMLDYHRIYGLKTVVFRHSSMYGGRQFATAEQGWIGWFCSQALQSVGNPHKRTFDISGNGKQVRDVLHSEDMVKLYFNALKYSETVAGEEFCIGGGIENSLSLIELFAFLEDALCTKLSWNCLPARCSDQLIFVADISKAFRLLKWTPEVNYKIGLLKMIDWVRSVPL